MATRRDQLQSYQFMVQRVISAFVMRETDPAQSPLRRGVGAVFAGVMITVMVAVGFGVAGILTKVGATNWKSDGSVVIEKETGASYVYVSGQLHPTLNYASALLASGKPKPTVARVSAKSLAGVPRGVTIGIAGAPDSLPGPKERIGLPWSVCVRPEPNRSGRTVSTTTIAVGTTPSAAAALDDQALLVREDGEDTTYLVWHGRRHLIERPKSMVPAIFGALATATPVGTAWLSTLPSGLDIKSITVDDRGKPSSKVKGRPIGQVLIAGPSRYLVLDEGLAPLTPLQEAVLGSQFSIRRVEVGVAETTGSPRSNQLNPTNAELAPPESPPALSTAAATDMLCATTDDAGTPPQVTSGGTLAGVDTAVPTTVRTRDGVRLADKVLVPSGRVAVIRVTGAPDAPVGTYHVVTDTGLRYAVPAPAVLQMLGYGPEQAIDVPSTLAIRIPAGPALDPQDAIKTATAGGAN